MTAKPPAEAKANAQSTEPTPPAATPDGLSSNHMKMKTHKSKEPGEAKANAGAMQTPSLAATPDREEIEAPAVVPADAPIQPEPNSDTEIKPGDIILPQNGQDGKPPAVQNSPPKVITPCRAFRHVIISAEELNRFLAATSSNEGGAK